jgi:lipoyl synthase
MPQPTPNRVWNATESELLKLLNSGVLIPQPKRIRFYAPSFTYYKTPAFCSNTQTFPTISVTGNTCALHCKHCGGKVLETMHSATKPSALLELCKRLKAEGAKGCLISGGCLPDGTVPLQEFTAIIAQIKRELGLTFFVHTGIISTETANQLKAANVDAALIDVIGDDETIQQVYNLTTTTKDYIESLQALSQAGIPFIPHVIVGLHHGKLKGEFAALQMIQQYQPAAIVIISFMPIHGTMMEKTKPPTPTDIARTAATARTMFPQTPIVLGCMRPKGKHREETDVLAMRAGVDAVAFPSESALKHAKQEGYRTAFSSFCCAQIYLDLTAEQFTP